MNSFYSTEFTVRERIDDLAQEKAAINLYEESKEGDPSAQPVQFARRLHLSWLNRVFSIFRAASPRQSAHSARSNVRVTLEHAKIEISSTAL